MKKIFNNKKVNNQGFTLIELILYIALMAIFISGAILFAWDIIYGGSKSNVELAVNQNLRFIAKRISYEIRNASAINYILANDLCLASSTAARNPTRIYLSSGKVRLAWGGGTSDCTSMTNDVSITSNNVTASSLSFTDRSSGLVSNNIEFSLNLSSSGARQEWQKDKTYVGAVELRSK